MLNIVIQSLIQPRVVGTVVGLSATITFLSLIVWTTVLGPVGTVLAVPATLFVKSIFVDVDPDRRWLIPLLSNVPNPEDSTSEDRPEDCRPPHRPDRRPPRTPAPPE